MAGPTTIVPESEPAYFSTEMVEVQLLLPGWEAAALEAAAHQHGLTVGQMLRRLIRPCTRPSQ
jgi:hypothetical protein